MINLTDTHTHLYHHDFDKDRSDMIKRAQQLGVGRFLMPNVDSASIERMMQQAKNHPGICIPMMGLHPCSVKTNWEEELDLIKKWLDKAKFCAIGEIGLDLYWDKTFYSEQIEVLKTQILWAVEHGLPVAIHCRNAHNEIIKALNDLKNEHPDKFPKFKGVFHCFTGNLIQAKEILDLGFHLGIGGVLTYKNSELDQVLSEISLEHIVLETDAPYLAPSPHRGKRNESAYVRLVAEKLALIKQCSLADIAEITTANAEKLFNL